MLWGVSWVSLQVWWNISKASARWMANSSPMETWIFSSSPLQPWKIWPWKASVWEFPLNIFIRYYLAKPNTLSSTLASQRVVDVRFSRVFCFRPSPIVVSPFAPDVISPSSPYLVTHLWVGTLTDNGTVDEERLKGIGWHSRERKEEESVENSNSVKRQQRDLLQINGMVGNGKRWKMQPNLIIAFVLVKRLPH